MSKLSLALATTILAIGAAAGFAAKDDDALTLAQISGYKQWTGLNAEPLKVEAPSGIALGEAPV